MASNFEVVVFQSNSRGKEFLGFDEKGEPIYKQIVRKVPKSVVLVGRRGRAEKFTYNAGGEADKLDELAEDVRDELPNGRDPYEALIEWIESEVRRAKGYQKRPGRAATVQK